MPKSTKLAGGWVCSRLNIEPSLTIPRPNGMPAIVLETNISDDQVALANQFAAKEKDLVIDPGQHFENLSQFSIPYLKSCKGIVFCELAKIEELKHASIVFGEVIGILNLETDSPLIYSNRKFFTLGQSLT